ncbi:probable F420-dependent oxidoreductase, Rv2161c family [Actinacidiphila yanglinensis]|uniref:Probable F420-dependent oxidoreductase, Rv2161c family n=1 Tax=Actinacidiphila yanglinensis TaxID=310779 RepID=A0A1H5SUI7_9ACTN|nr:LLM class F420-dependent oxidoreductase [Actinacidiphila yanglinensis]SEF54189.1 probable F420-dependent oxidoreductase, Rv2161c family [Actinacidiphila yanglinensis]
MKFGISTFITDRSIRPAPLGRALEERAFDSLFIAEHSHIPADRSSEYPGGGELPEMYYRTLDPFVALTAVASVTEELLVGTGIALIAQRDPIHMAKEVASLDLVSGGRFVFGVGVGWNREEMANHGTDPASRGRLANERLRAMIELWTQEKAEFHGEFVDFDPVYAWPKPVRRPHPPIYVGGGQAAFPRVAEFGDAWLANSLPPKVMGERMKELRAVAGRDIPVTVYGAKAEPETVEGYAELGVERVQFMLPSVAEPAALERLDAFAELAARYR